MQCSGSSLSDMRGEHHSGMSHSAAICLVIVQAARMQVLELGVLIRTGQVSSVELTDVFQQRLKM